MKLKNKKLLISKENEESLKLSKESLLGGIIESTDALTPKQLKDKNKEKEKTKFQLYGSNPISIKEIKDLKAENRQPYAPHFGYEKPFYKEIYRLNGWPESEHTKFKKREEVPIWTWRIIYGRFPDGIRQHLRKQNQFLFAYIRLDKYFQYLNKEGQEMLDKFIEDFIIMSVGYNDWDSFEKDYCEKYNILGRQTKTA